MSKKKIKIIKLLSSKGTNHFYTITKNKKNLLKKLKLRKYDPVFKKHVIYTESKIK
ncbi:MAG: 50S ribosomal protein L33 [Candidatus Makana argininalis]